MVVKILPQLDRLAMVYPLAPFILKVPFPGQGLGLKGLKDVLGSMRCAFPDLHFSVEEQIAEGDKVLTRFEWTGTHQGEFLGVSPTERHVKIWGMVIDRLVNGRIKETRIIMDTLGLMAQLGVFPPERAGNWHRLMNWDTLQG